jgi:hypothetical protein
MVELEVLNSICNLASLPDIGHIVLLYPVRVETGGGLSARI